MKIPSFLNPYKDHDRDGGHRQISKDGTLVIVWKDEYATLTAAIAAVGKPGIVIHESRFYYVISTAKIEQRSMHCIINGSFEHWTGGNPDFWTRKS